LGSVNSPSLRPALPALALLLVCAAQAQTAAVPPAAMQRALALAQSVAAAIAPQDARVVALPGVADPRLMLAPCAQVDVYLPAGVPPWGRTRVGLRCTSGPVRWNVFMPITVQVLAPALALNTALPAGARITESQLQRVQADWGALPQPPFAAPESLLGRTLARPVAAGQPLQAGDLQARHWFSAGEPVRVLASGSGFAVASEGVALTPGVEGQPARVRVAGDRVLVGRATGERQVEVGP
jgi:flagellar basal body P-ring formation protein FlgA